MITSEERAEWRQRMTSKMWCGHPDMTEFALRLLDEDEARNDEREEAMAELMDYTRALEVLLQKHFPDFEPGATKEGDLIIGERIARAEQAEAQLAALIDWCAVDCPRCPVQKEMLCNDRDAPVSCQGSIQIWLQQQAQKRGEVK